VSIADGANPAAFPPRSLIVTLYGLYAREHAGWFSVAALVRLMAALDVDEPAVRSSISRLKRRQILTSRRVQGVAGYALSPAASSLLEEGDRRIFRAPRADPGEGWVLAVFSVPEAERSNRHTLRSRLTGLGFGTVASGVWVAPAHLDQETSDVLTRAGLDRYVTLFRADFRAFGDVSEAVRKWWDLEELQRMYDQFISRYTPIASKWRRQRKTAGDEAFVDYTRALTAWRRLAYLDPGLPGKVLPPAWSGARAADLFFSLERRLAEPAHRFVDEVRSPVTAQRGYTP
jgi:phenylacetic acid degradation operon negative regulatory protein